MHHWSFINVLQKVLVFPVRFLYATLARTRYDDSTCQAKVKQIYYKVNLLFFLSYGIYCIIAAENLATLTRSLVATKS